ncbi:MULTISPECIES: hypothetical protein [Caballeronia]|jgi:hypothetical protein|uniref:hypothetical protein n=1 Tax=Caballeronia TaxID=1827195 RepID=UPI001FD2764C|nr:MULTISPECIES: hypothetical protein [Caballeronia]MDR5736251.1 hypothetical protein [Caballeronia sp. LZ025]
MENGEVTYKSFVLRPLAAYDDGMYVAMLILRNGDGIQTASGVLGSFACALDARRFALKHGMDEIDQGAVPKTESQPRRQSAFRTLQA